ncbi:MAG: hypothetical protein V2A65_05985 [Candidatus Omnitrophota bacterium]
MNDREIIKYLIENIRRELSNLNEICLQISPLIEKTGKADDKERVFYNRAAGSILHDFYTGLEKIFCNITNRLNKGLPEGEDWHIQLLRNMAEPKGKRPQVISLELMEELKEYLGFRHLFRNIYGTQLKWDKLRFLLVKIQDTLWKRLKDEVDLFIEYLEREKENRKRWNIFFY